MCESTRGKWGEPCPDCGVTLPSKSKKTYFVARDEAREDAIRLWRNPEAGFGSVGIESRRRLRS
jgi:hypothetical protein